MYRPLAFSGPILLKYIHYHHQAIHSKVSVCVGASPKSFKNRRSIICCHKMLSWDQRYSEEDFAYGTEPNTFLKDSLNGLKLAPGATCLLLAEGEGRNGVFMAEKGFQVTGVDSSKVGLEKAQKLAQARSVKLETIVADLAQYDLGQEKWDCIVGIFCHLPPLVRDKVLSGIPGALRRDGVALFEAYTPQQLEYKTGGPPVAEMMFSAEIFRKAFDGKLEIERNDELIREVVEGKYHTGKAAVVQFIGRKLS